MTLSTGLLVGLPIIVIVVLAFAIFAVIAYKLGRIGNGDPIVWFGLAIVAGLVSLGFVIGSLIGYWPYKMEYHAWYPTAGNVAAVSQRLVSDGDNGMTQRYVVQFTDGRQRACDDTRCSLLKPGAYLELKCIREYQWGGTPGYSCNYVRSHS